MTIKWKPSARPRRLAAGLSASSAWRSRLPGQWLLRGACLTEDRNLATAFDMRPRCKLCQTQAGPFILIQIKVRGTSPPQNFSMQWTPIANAPFDCDLELAVLDEMALMLLHSPVAALPADGLTLKQKTRSTCARRIGGNGPQSPRSCAVMLDEVLRRPRLTWSSQLQ